MSLGWCAGCRVCLVSVVPGCFVCVRPGLGLIRLFPGRGDWRAALGRPRGPPVGVWRGGDGACFIGIVGSIVEEYVVLGGEGVWWLWWV